MPKRSNVDTLWFKQQMDDVGLSVRKMAPLIGIHFTALSRALSGERRVQIDEVRKIAAVLGKTEIEVLRHLGGPVDTPSGQDSNVGFMEDQMAFKTGTEEDPVAPRHPMFGCMKGLGSVEPGYDLTRPIFPDWAEYEEKKYGSGSKLYDE